MEDFDMPYAQLSMPETNYTVRVRQIISILAIASVLTGCQKQQEQLEKLVFDNSQVVYKTVYRYNFDEKGRIKANRRTDYRHRAGVLLDSSVSETLFEYNKKGKLVSSTDFPDSSKRVRIYNELDSLVGDYTINRFGDTTHFYVTVYGGGSMVRRIDRVLNLKLPKSFQNITDKDLRNYDTLLSVIDMIYDKDHHVRTLFLDKVGKISEEAEHYYENSQMAKTVKYAYLGDAKYIKETTFYHSSEENEPDFVTVGTLGDTTAFKKTVSKRDGRVVWTYVEEIGMHDLWYYNNKDQLIAVEVMDVAAGEKTVSKYTYDKKGNVAEMVTFTQKMNRSL